MIVSVTLNPCVDRTFFLPGIKLHDTNRVQRDEADAGGKGINVSRIARELGAETLATGFLGGHSGDFVAKILSEHGIPMQFVATAAETRTNVSVESGDGPPTTFNARGGPVTLAEWEALQGLVAEMASPGVWIALGGSLPAGLSQDSFVALLRIARAKGSKVLVDADGEPMQLALAERPDLIKPNHEEAGRILGRGLAEDDFALAEASQGLLGHVAPGGAAIISLGASGAILAAEHGVWRGYSPQVVPKSTIGSGDSLLGGVLASLEHEKSWPEALRVGLAAGAATATTDGTTIGDRATIEDLLPQASVVRIE